MGISGVLLVLFVALKILGIAPVASWSWWWVTSPAWGRFLVWCVAVAWCWGE